jgi:protein TonB
MPTSNVVFVPMVATPVPPPPAVRRIETVTKPSTNPNAPPVEAPDGITKEPLSGLEFDEGVEAGPSIADIGVVHGIESLTAPPPPPSTQPKTVRQGGDIRPPQKIRDVAAVYPPIAQAARVQGVVIVEATIGTDGRVKDAHVLRSVPLLDEAALAAVRQWVYTPTRLNGEPVSVIMTVTVRFQLN